jgi:hypothetical protein
MDCTNQIGGARTPAPLRAGRRAALDASAVRNSVTGGAWCERAGLGCTCGDCERRCRCGWAARARIDSNARPHGHANTAPTLSRRQRTRLLHSLSWQAGHQMVLFSPARPWDDDWGSGAAALPPPPSPTPVVRSRATRAHQREGWSCPGEGCAPHPPTGERASGGTAGRQVRKKGRVEGAQRCRCWRLCLPALVGPHMPGVCVVHAHTHTHTHTHTHIHTHTRTHARTHWHARTHARRHAHAHTRAHTHAQTHPHAHTQMDRLFKPQHHCQSITATHTHTTSAPRARIDPNHTRPCFRNTPTSGQVQGTATQQATTCPRYRRGARVEPGRGAEALELVRRRGTPPPLHLARGRAHGVP